MQDRDHTSEIVAPEGEDVADAPGVERASAQPGDVLPEHADDAAAIDGFLSGYGRGFQITIIRTAPVWCAGYLTTLPLDHGITLNEIRESYGGRRFQLRILTDQGRFVTMRSVLISDVPRDDGKPIASLDRGSSETPRPNPAPASGFGELAGVLRDLLASQQAASDRQAEMLEKMILRPVEQAQAAIVSPLEQIQQLGEVIAAVRELAPTIAPGAEGGGDGGEGMMLKLAEKLITKWGDKEPKPRAAINVTPGRAPGAPGTPGARRAPIIIQGPRPAGIPAPPPCCDGSPTVPNETTIAAMREARETRPAADAPPAASVIAAVPLPNPSAPASGTVDDSSISQLPENEHGSDEDYTAEDVRDLLAGMPVDDAAEVMRDVFDALDPADKDRAIKIFLGQTEEKSIVSTSSIDNPTRNDP